MMKTEEMADFYEAFADHLNVKLAHWLLSGGFDKPEEMKIISEFVGWVRKETEEAIHVPRGPEGISFAEWRKRKNEAKTTD